MKSRLGRDSNGHNSDGPPEGYQEPYGSLRTAEADFARKPRHGEAFGSIQDFQSEAKYQAISLQEDSTRLRSGQQATNRYESPLRDGNKPADAN